MTILAAQPHVKALLDQYDVPSASATELLCARHPRKHTAFTFVNAELSASSISYGELLDSAERLAAAFAELGIGPGDRVATLMGKTRDFVVTLMAVWHLGAVHVPLFTAFAPPQIELRLNGSRAKAVVCDAANLPKLKPSADLSADGGRTTIVSGAAPTSPGEVALDALMASSASPSQPARLGGDAPLVQLYTSGTTGAPKGVLVPIRALAAFHAYLQFGLDVVPGDVYWNAADPGWAYGLYYGVLAPLATGVPAIMVTAGFSPELTWSVLARYGVTNFAAAPTVYRALRAGTDRQPQGVRLRCASSAGEPLTPEVNEWAVEALGVAVHDHYGQTETGMLVNNHHHPSLRSSLKPGSMGRPMPGWSVRVLRDVEQAVAAAPGEPGVLAVDTAGSPLAWFTGYVDDPARSREKFSADRRWYLTGDLASVDEAGRFHFSSREDDVIIMAGYRIGPFEVESVIARHPDVAECAVVAAPDDIRGEVLEAYVVTRTAVDSRQLEAEVQRLVKTEFAAHAYPRAVHVVDHLPKTPSGKVQRFALRQQRNAASG
ncbi:AMP-binding protein [Amycolatopsis thermoflava]|uniref:AMP-binding protein n=1 Tax=Amycolatopsis thermoflava TaxID=84480 RepID=UPI003D709245